MGFNNKYPNTIAIGLNKAENENRNNNSDNYYCQIINKKIFQLFQL